MKNNLNKNASLKELKQAPKQFVAGLAIMLLCSVAGGAILNTQNQTETLMVLNRDVAAGDAVSAQYFDVKEVLVSNLRSNWLKPEEVDDGSFFAIALSEGDALRAADISRISSDLRLVSFAVEETNLPANLRAGEEVDFWEVGQSQTRPVAYGLPVQSVTYRENRGVFQLNLLVSPMEVEEVLSAISNESFALITNVN